MTDYSGNLFEPALNYKMDFDPKKKATEHTMSVAYGKMMKIEDRRQGSNSENIGAQGNYTKISRYQCGRTTIYYQRIQDQNKRYINVEHTKVDRMAKDPITWTKERME